MPTSSVGSHSSEAGVTLIEMMVVVTIIGLIAGVTLPGISAGMDSIRLATASDSVAAFINGAVNRAERGQQPVELVISRKDNTLALYSNQPGSDREWKPPEGITIQDILPEIEGDPGDVRRLVLMPGATVPGIGVEIGNRHGSRRIVRLDPMTGFPRVESVHTE